MKDVKIVFTDRIQDIQTNLQNANYSVCNRISHDLVTFAWNLELKDEVFISEVLESVFGNLEETSAQYNIPKNIQEKIVSDVSEKIKLLRETYETKDPCKLYESLKQLRYVTTQHQLHVWQRCDMPSQISRRIIR